MLQHAHELQRRIGGRVTRSESIHITLAFLGDIPESALHRLCDLEMPVHCSPFTLELDQLGCWRHNGIGWLAPSVSPQVLKALQQQLYETLSAQDFRLEARSFKPHSTLVRRAEGALPTIRIDPLMWPIDSYVLVRSDLDQPSARYDVVKRYALREQGE